MIGKELSSLNVYFYQWTDHITYSATTNALHVYFMQLLKEEELQNALLSMSK
jgi:hypothetical protein